MKAPKNIYAVIRDSDGAVQFSATKRTKLTVYEGETVIKYSRADKPAKKGKK